MDATDPILVYVAGPFTKPDCCVNTREAILAADQLCARGFVPYLPHLTLLWHTVSPHPYEFWISLDMHWLRMCHAVFRLPGESAGADRETNEAKKCGIPVFESWGELEAWRR